MVLLLEPIPDTPDGFDVFSGFVQLFPQPEDLHVHGSGGDGIIITPDLINNLLPAEDPARPAGQHQQNSEFGRGQLDRFAGNKDFVPPWRDAEIMDRDDLFRLGIRCFLVNISAHDGLDPGHQHFRAKGLGYVIISTAVQTGHDITFFAQGGQHDNREVLILRIFSDVGTDFHAVFSGQHQVQNNCGDILFSQELQCLLAAVRATDIVSGPDQVIADQLLDIHVIFHH